MTDKEIKIREDYQAKMDEVDTAFEKNIIKAEMEHKLKMLHEGINEDDNKQAREESQFDCIGCGS
jgi:hypothetical protein